MKNLIILTGPTAVGKTELSINLARAVNGEIISADSMQIYKKMNIGTAKITKAEMEDIPHHLIDILEPDEEFNVVLFKEYAKKAMEDIYARGRLPIVVGGTGFYIQALLYDVDFTENDSDMSYRQELLRLSQEKGNRYLHDMLRRVDPVSADKIHENNVRRVIRALEFYEKTGEKISEHNERESQNKSPYNFEYFVLNNNRQVLYDRIDRRVDIMLEQGLVEEVKSLLDMGYDTGLTSMQGLGYKEIAQYLKGECTLEEAIYILKRDTRHFAKRQLTWFKREREVTWIDKSTYPDEAAALAEMLNKLHDKEII
jgi:tRNA dimethylallyltransferase